MVVCLTYMIPQLNYLLNNYSMYILPIHQRLAKDDPEGRHGRSMLNRAITATGVFYILIYTAVCLNHQKRGDGAELIIAVLLNDSSLILDLKDLYISSDVKADKRVRWEQEEPETNYLKFEDYKAYKARLINPDTLSRKHMFHGLSYLNQGKDTSMDPVFHSPFSTPQQKRAMTTKNADSSSLRLGSRMMSAQ